MEENESLDELMASMPHEKREKFRHFRRMVRSAHHFALCLFDTRSELAKLRDEVKAMRELLEEIPVGSKGGKAA